MRQHLSASLMEGSGSKPVLKGDETPSLAALLRFLALAFSWSWASWWLAPVVQAEYPVAFTALSLAGGFGPSLAAVVVIAYGGGWVGLRHWLKGCTAWPGWLWVALAFVLPAVLMGLAAAIHVALGGTVPTSPAAGHIALAALNFLLVFLVGGPLGEELGWRGFALPALQARWSWRVASVVLGAIWAVWHLPLFYMAGTAQSPLPMGWYALSLVASSVLFTWIFNRSQGSLVAVWVLHTAVNAWALIIPVMVLPDGSNVRPFQLVVGLLVLVAIGLWCSGERVFNKSAGRA